MIYSVIIPTKLDYFDDIFYGNNTRNTNVIPINKYSYLLADAEVGKDLAEDVVGGDLAGYFS